MQQVRESAAWVSARAEYVTIDHAAVSKFAGTIDPATLSDAKLWDQSFHFSGGYEETLNYVFTLDAINFGSAFARSWAPGKLGSTYRIIAESLKRAAEANVALDAEFARNATLESLAAIFPADLPVELSEMFTISLCELGAWVSERYESYAELIDSLPESGRAGALVDELVSNLPAFRDAARYQEREVCFYKRAQILAHDIHLALSVDARCRFDDIGRLTAFADNLLPHVLRIEGVLKFAPELLRKIDVGEEIPAGSAEEIEIRAQALHAVELLSEEIAGSPPPRLVDAYLWLQGQDVRYKQHPRHVTKTIYY